MITSKDIKAILSQVQSGTKMEIGAIQSLIRHNYRLVKADWQPHTSTRLTDYPKWKHRLQAVLSEYKKSGKVIHNPATNSYTFI